MYQVKNSHKLSYEWQKKYCKSFKSFAELGKKIFSNKFLPEAILPSAKNSMILTAPYSGVSSPMTNLFYQSYSNILGTCSKILNLNDAWFGFYSHFKKGLLHVHMVNIIIFCLMFFLNYL